jgi:hypothetical protein
VRELRTCSEPRVLVAQVVVAFASARSGTPALTCGRVAKRHGVGLSVDRLKANRVFAHRSADVLALRCIERCAERAQNTLGARTHVLKARKKFSVTLLSGICARPSAAVGRCPPRTCRRAPLRCWRKYMCGCRSCTSWRDRGVESALECVDSRRSERTSSTKGLALCHGSTHLVRHLRPAAAHACARAVCA